MFTLCPYALSQTSVGGLLPGYRPGRVWTYADLITSKQVRKGNPAVQGLPTINWDSTYGARRVL